MIILLLISIFLSINDDKTEGQTKPADLLHLGKKGYTIRLSTFMSNFISLREEKESCVFNGNVLLFYNG